MMPIYVLVAIASKLSFFCEMADAQMGCSNPSRLHPIETLSFYLDVSALSGTTIMTMV